MEYSHTLKIPKERIAVLIGKNGETKKEIEDHTKTNLKIDSKEGIVIVTGKDAILVYTAKEIINAIARGFNPDIASLLLKPDYSFELVSITEFAPTNKAMHRLKGRVIGQKGKARNTIETLTKTYISVYGKTVGIIGLIEGVTNARRAIESLLSGSSHSKVYKWLERNQVDLISKEVLNDSDNFKEPK